MLPYLHSLKIELTIDIHCEWHPTHRYVLLTSGWISAPLTNSYLCFPGQWSKMSNRGNENETPLIVTHLLEESKGLLSILHPTPTSTTTVLPNYQRMMRESWASGATKTIIPNCNSNYLWVQRSLLCLSLFWSIDASGAWEIWVTS